MLPTKDRPLSYMPTLTFLGSCSHFSELASVGVGGKSASRFEFTSKCREVWRKSQIIVMGAEEPVV